ncbi:MAG TPA: sigma-54 dependent transcriptional regulator [Candidatus Eisenbacteria bacterium]|nr:sigma-54 dependent transcriptional regulator [Candidatus Eisenbacteria bacterium]
MRVLVVDDEVRNAELVARAMADAGHDAHWVNGGKAALARLEQGQPDAIVTDVRMPPPDGLELLAQVRARWPDVTVVLMSAYRDMEMMRKALRLGAHDFVDKEGDYHDQLTVILERVARERQLVHDNVRLEGEVATLREGLATVIGQSPAVRHALELARKVAPTDSTVLLRGESGTGKDLFARAIHFSSRRANGPWVKVNCGALPEALLESELFGHERGAFTGAVRQKPGRFEDANHGSIFLDEIGELPMPLQVKLLQVIEEKTFTRVGGNQPIKVDVRIIAATNRDLEEMVRERAFREDLLFRLNVFPIVLPPLRERPGDVRALVEFFLRRHGLPPEHVAPEAMRALERHTWPGNVRELEHALERASILAGSDAIDVEHLSLAPSAAAAAAGMWSGAREPWVPTIPPEGLSLETLERELILQALERSGGNKSQAARLLGVTRRTLYSRMERHGLRKPGEGEADEGDGEDAVQPGAGA